jgi:hypothetical protein
MRRLRIEAPALPGMELYGQTALKAAKQDRPIDVLSDSQQKNG